MLCVCVWWGGRAKMLWEKHWCLFPALSCNFTSLTDLNFFAQCCLFTFYFHPGFSWLKKFLQLFFIFFPCSMSHILACPFCHLPEFLDHFSCLSIFQPNDYVGLRFNIHKFSALTSSPWDISRVLICYLQVFLSVGIILEFNLLWVTFQIKPEKGLPPIGCKFG